MKKFLALTFTLLMLFSCCTTTAFASNAPADSSSTITPREVVYLVDFTTGMLMTGPKSFRVTPAAGTNLRIILNSPEIPAVVSVNNQYITTVTPNDVSKNILLVSNCTGYTSYTVTIYTERYTTVFGFIASASV